MSEPTGGQLPRCRRCGVRPGTPRFYVPNALGASLAGMQTKFSVKETVGCDECWAEFQAEHAGSSRGGR